MNRNNALLVLGVDPTATHEEIRVAYRDLASRHHPDHGGDAKSFARLQEAYETLLQADEVHISRSLDPEWVPGVPPRPPSPVRKPPRDLQSGGRNRLLVPAIILLTITSFWLGLVLYGALRGGTIVPIVFIPVSASAFIAAGCIAMISRRFWTLAILAAVAACIPCLSPFFLAGLPLGIWCLCLLTEKGVRELFDF